MKDKCQLFHDEIIMEFCRGGDGFNDYWEPRELGRWLIQGGAGCHLDIPDVTMPQVPGHELLSVIFFPFLSEKLSQASHSSLSYPLHGQRYSSERILSRHQGHGQNETRGPQRCQTHELKILILRFPNQLSMILLNDSWIRVLFVLIFLKNSQNLN